MTLKQLIKQKKLDWVNANITEENFPQEKIRKGEYKLFHFDKNISSEDVIQEMKKEGYSPANIYELLAWKDWNKKDWVVALGSSCRVFGNRLVACLGGDGSERRLNLDWWGDRWGGSYRFLAVRTLDSQTLEKETLCPYCKKPLKIVKEDE